MSTSVVGIDIGSVAIRAVEVKDPDKAKPTILRYSELPLPAGAVNRGEVVEPNTVSSVLKRLWSTGGFTSKNVVIGMGNQRVLARDLTLPKMSQARLRESLPYQVQELLPVPVTEAMLDFYPVSEELTAGGPVVHGLLVAAIKEAVLGNVRAVEKSGLTTTGVDLIPFALTRVLLRNGNAAGTVAIVDIGASATTVVIATNGVPQFLRIIPAGGDDLTTALTQRLEIETEQAEALKRGIGLRTRVDDPQHQRPMEIINEVTNELLSSARNTLDYFGQSRPDAPVKRILLTGGGARLSGLPDALAELTRAPVVAADPFAGLTVSKSLRADDLRHNQSAILVALGLALGSTA
ncbi:MAG TPA: type IV pilus assembly protein PilM [Mycetocola sp.]|jgi:type IV pilus assembly protein PilM|uniref:type IV pilus assembly protein PilM n=1 Tax=Mycetocola sp. TaxID=1871042 RepID=UPI00262E1891|nr:type IV pilus assembly protein PilM [Mycetocola sp.]MCU1561513.1 pilus assembly protein PilM [Mycetocola sp.]HEV7848573.1 type IV pilus assembly protein PilM [Mycetocola sp.]